MNFLCWEWGTVSDWVTAIATVGALIAAIIAGRAALRQVHLAQEQAASAAAQAHLAQGQANRLIQDDRQRLASRVSAWAFHSVKDGYGVYALNASGLPIYSVVVVVLTPKMRKKFHAKVVPPTRKRILSPGASRWLNSHVAANPSVAISITPTAAKKYIGQKDADGTEPKRGEFGVAIIFTDSQGVRWERGFDGLLTERQSDYENKYEKPDDLVGDAS